MHKIFKIIIFIIAVLIMLPLTQVFAIELESDTINNYKIIIEDDANLLTDSEEAELKKHMVVLSEYGNVLFKTTNNVNNTKAIQYIKNYYYSQYKNKPGVAFYIDMYQRQICVCATGSLEKYITSGKSDTITDNVYTYASKGKYYECAKEAYAQMNSLLNGMKIAEPMKYICNSFIAVMISLFASYGFFMLCARNGKASEKELINECVVSLEHSSINVAKTGTHREYSPESDSGFSGGSSGGGGRRRLFWKRRKPRILIENH